MHLLSPLIRTISTSQHPSKQHSHYHCSYRNDLPKLQGKGTNEKGLCYFPEGRKYYEWYIQQSVGVTDTIQELEQLTRRQISEDITGMEEAVNEAKQAAAILEDEKAERILEKLKKGIGTAFPEIPKTSLRIKYVPEEMQEHLSPAFYMIPAIDYTEENVIYVNQIQMRDDLALFTTLAHEGYPGHLYQTIFFESTNPDPIRSILNFGGYVEGWFTCWRNLQMRAYMGQ